MSKQRNEQRSHSQFRPPFTLDSIATPAGLKAYLDSKGFDSNFFRQTLRDAPLTEAELADVLYPDHNQDYPPPAPHSAPQRRQTNPPPHPPECAQMCTNVPERATPAILQNEPTGQNGSQPQLPSTRALSPRQLHAAQLLLAGHTAKSVAAILQVNPHTISRWKKLPAFQKHLHGLLQQHRGPAPPTHPPA